MAMSSKARGFAPVGGPRRAGSMAHPAMANKGPPAGEREGGGRPARLPVRDTGVQPPPALRCAQAVVRFSISANSSYITIAIAPTTTRPAKATLICIDEPADISR